MGHSSSKVDGTALEPEVPQQPIPIPQRRRRPIRPTTPDLEYQDTPPRYEMIESSSNSRANRRLGVVFPSAPDFTPYAGQLFTPEPRLQSFPGNVYESDEYTEMNRFIATISLGNGVPEPRAIPRQPVSQPALFSPRPLRPDTSQAPSSFTRPIRPIRPIRPEASQPTLYSPPVLRSQVSQPALFSPRPLRPGTSQPVSSLPVPLRTQADQPVLYSPSVLKPQVSQPNFSRPISGLPTPALLHQGHPQANQPDELAARFQRLRDPSLSSAYRPRPRASEPELNTASRHRVYRAVSSTNVNENFAQTRGGRPSRLARLEENPFIDAAAATQECSICIEDKPLSDFPKITNKCKHISTTCLTCLREWVKGELNSMTWNKLKCPGQKCKAILGHADMKRLAGRDVFEKYDKFATLSVLSTMPNFRWCIAPSCPSGQIHITGTDGPIFRCTSCNFRACVIHNVSWHSGLTCREYDYAQDPSLRRREEKASEKAIKELSRRCPGKSCGAPIIRNGGCDHMTCTKCRHEFCWICFADYKQIRKKGNEAHRTDCKLHSRNLT